MQLLGWGKGYWKFEPSINRIIVPPAKANCDRWTDIRVGDPYVALGSTGTNENCRLYIISRYKMYNIIYDTSTYMSDQL